MRVSLEKIISEIRSRSIQQRRVFTVILVLSLFISTGVVWKLRSVGITMANDVSCGIEEHEHSDECYSTDYICGYGNPDTDSPEHVHTEECLDRELICTQSVHIHSIRCCDNSLVAEKDEESDELPVVEIPVPEIKDTVSEDDTDETDVDDEDEFVSDDGSYLSDEDDVDYDEIAQRVLNGTHLSPIVEMELVTPSSGDIYLKNSDGSHESIGSTFTTIAGAGFTFCIHGENNDLDQNFFGDKRASEKNYGYYDLNDVNKEILTITQGGTANEKTGAFVAKTPGITEVRYHQNNANGNYSDRQKVEVKPSTDLGKVFIVNADGTEEYKPQLTVDKGTKLTFCVYSGDDTTFECSTSHNHTSDCKQNYMFIDGLANQSEAMRWFDDKRDGYSGKLIRRDERTYIFNKTGIYKVNFNSGQSCTVNVSSPGYPNTFDADKLYKIYWVKDDGTEVLDQIPEIYVGGKLKFRIYTDYKNTVNPDVPNKAEHTIYMNEMQYNGIDGDYSVPAKYYQDPRFPDDLTKEIRIYEISYTFNKPGDFDVLYSAVTAHEVHVYPKITNDGVMLLKTGNTYIDLSGQYVYNPSDKDRYKVESDRYKMEFGDEVELIGYTADDKSHWFFNSKINEVEQKNIVYTNPEHTFGNNPLVRSVRTRVTAQEKGDSNFHFTNSKFCVSVNERIINEIYVETELGERMKHKVHERGTTYEPNANSNNNRYILYMDGSYKQQVPICIYTERNDNGNGNLVFKSADISGESQLNFSSSNVVEILPQSVGTKNIQGVDYKKVSVFVQAKSPGNTAVYFDPVGNNAPDDYVYFYVEVRSSNSGDVKDWQDHADIEISDGGYYEVTKELYSSDGKTKIEYYERYDTHILKVNECKIFGDGDTVLYTFKDTDYVPSGTSGQQQYEFNSKQENNGEPRYDQYKVRGAQFDVSVILIPNTARKNVMSMDENGSWGPAQSTSYEVQSKTVSNLIFTFGMHGVVDALNKCSDHSGMDFSVSECLNEVIAQVSFVAEKVFVDENGNVLSYNEGTLGKLTDSAKKFEFELYRANDSRVELSQNKQDGSVIFSDFFLKRSDLTEKYQDAGMTHEAPCRNFEFTLKEVAPTGAINNYISYGGLGIMLDSHVSTFYVRVYEDGGILKTGYYTNSNHAESAGNGAVFTNKVYNERYEDFKVEKKWEGEPNNVQHNPISFEFIRTDQNGNEALVSINNQVRHNLGSSNSWSFNHQLPVEYAGKKYTYKVREVSVPYGYDVEYDYNSETKTYTIKNIKNYSGNLWIKKEWQNHDGTPDNSPEISEVSVKLLRRKQSVPVPVNVSLYSEYCYDGDYYDKVFKYTSKEFESYIGESFSFDVDVSTPGNIPGNIEVKNVNCNVNMTKNGNRYTFDVSGMTDAASIELKYVPDSSVVLKSNNFNEWQQRNSILDTTGGYLMVKDRKQTYSGAQYFFSSEPFKSAKELRFKFISKQYKDGNPSSIGLKYTMVLPTNDPNNPKYVTLNQAMVERDVDWKFEKCFTMQDYNNNDNYSICFECLDDKNTWIHMLQCEMEAVNFPISYTVSEKIVTHSDGIISGWTEDDAFNNSNSYIYTLNSTNNWKIQLPVDNLNQEQSGIVYQYYVREDVSRFHGYESPVYLNKNVASNTENTPITVLNKKAIPYTLPATGGPGTFKIRAVGGILAFGAAAGFVVRRRKKRKSV